MNPQIPDVSPGPGPGSSRPEGPSRPLEPEALLVSHSPLFRAFMDELRQVAGSEANVLLEGENGTGKSLAAAWLHGAGPRAGQPLVEVSIAALAPTLVDSELFGHVEGAFTGAQVARRGRFRAASGGTLVLEGIDGLSQELQVKLLRTLQERVVEPLGGEVPQAIDIRVVATSAKNLRAEVEAGRFREDLYYRLAVVTLRVPPLRTRREDLPELARLLTERVARRARVAPRPLGADALERLQAHCWPGNVRELENSLERVMVLAPAGRAAAPVAPVAPIAAAELDFLDEALEGAAEQVARKALSLGLSLDQVNEALIEAAVREQGGNLSAAARSVGLSRRAFDYRRKKQGKAESDGARAGRRPGRPGPGGKGEAGRAPGEA